VDLPVHVDWDKGKEKKRVDMGIEVTATVGRHIVFTRGLEDNVNDPKQTLSLWDKWATMKICGKLRG